MTEMLANVVPITHGAERLDFGRVKGAIIRAHLDWVRDHGSRGEIIGLFEDIPDLLRYQISTLAPAAWYPFRTLIAVDRMIVERFGNGESKFAHELGAYLAQRTLSDIRRFFGAPGLHDFFRHAAMLHREWYDFGSAEYVETSERSGCLIRRGYGAHSPLDCASIGGFYRECIRIHGAEAAVRESACRCRADSFCAFDLSWRF
jgi:hypothetical protein